MAITSVKSHCSPKDIQFITRPHHVYLVELIVWRDFKCEFSCIRVWMRKRSVKDVDIPHIKCNILLHGFQYYGFIHRCFSPLNKASRNGTISKCHDRIGHYKLVILNDKYRMIQCCPFSYSFVLLFCFVHVITRSSDYMSSLSEEY